MSRFLKRKKMTIENFSFIVILPAFLFFFFMILLYDKSLEFQKDVSKFHPKTHFT